MGILERLGLRQRSFSSTPKNLGIASPFQEGSLGQIVLADLLGAEVAEDLPIGREDAMAVPAVAKARNLLVSTIAGFPLKALDDRGDLKTQPAWLYRTNSDVSPQERMVWTVDDGFFYGLSLWLTDRGEADRSGRKPILNAEYCPWDKWEVRDGKILVNEKPVQDDEIILFNFWGGGILYEGHRTIRAARDLEKAVAGRVRNPSPLIDLHVTDDTNLTQTEAAAYVKTWGIARRNPDGAVASTPPGIDLRVLGTLPTDLYENARNAVRTDVGSFSNVRASMLDGTAGIDSLTYKTGETERNSYYEFDTPYWTQPIEARLSQDDILPRGQRVRFDKYENYAPTPTPTGAPTED